MTKQEIATQYLMSDWDGEETEEEIAAFLGMHRTTVSRAKAELEEGAVKSVQDARFDTEADKRQQVREYRDAHPNASLRDIAANVDADISHEMVRQYLEEPSASEATEAAPGATDDRGGPPQSEWGSPEPDPDTRGPS